MAPPKMGRDLRAVSALYSGMMSVVGNLQTVTNLDG
jgi:hypothetical protein